MIRQILSRLESELGTTFPAEAKIRVESWFHQSLGGELRYIPKSPKSETMRRIENYGTALSARDVASAIGCTPRYVRRIRRLLWG